MRAVEPNPQGYLHERSQTFFQGEGGKNPLFA
jgi:hypothetical protein